MHLDLHFESFKFSLKLSNSFVTFYDFMPELNSKLCCVRETKEKEIQREQL